MKKYAYIIGNLCLLILLGLLTGFTNNRFEESKTTGLQIVFEGTSKRFMNDSVVNKLLIQNQKEPQGIRISEVDLNRLEKALYAHPYTAWAEINLNIDKTLEVKIRQKSPLVRILSDTAYYLADDLSFVPLSGLYSARVPLVSGNVKDIDRSTLYTLANNLQSDEVLKKFIIGINYQPQGIIELIPRLYDYKIILGNGQDLPKKLTKLKIFLSYMDQHKLHQHYQILNMQYPNQLVCTKRNEYGT